MRYALSCLLAGVLFVGGPALAQAGCYGTSYYTPTYYTPAYEQKVVINQIQNRVTVLEYVPLYAVGLASPYAVPTVPVAPAVTAAPQSACEQKFAALEAKFSALEAKLSTPGVAPPVVLPSTAPQKTQSKREEVIQSGVAVLQSRCAACHTGATSKKDPESGNPVVIFSEPGKLSAEVDVVALMIAAEGDTMPKGGKLTADEKKAVRDMVRAASRK